MPEDGRPADLEEIPDETGRSLNLIDMRKRYVRVVAGAAMLSIVAAACGSSSNKGEGTTAAPQQTTVAPDKVPTGGTLTVGAEQEPDCMDWMGSCGGSSWGFWMAGVTTMPSAILPLKQADGNLKNVPGPVLDGTMP